jgi:biopolymer transport protein ExbB/TolQ
MMTVVSWIQFGALLVAILALVFQQYRVYQQQQQANQLAKSIELRTETKLRVFYIVQDEQLSLDEILHKLRDQSPLNRSGDTEEEIRKALYEMLQDETVRLLYNKK